MVHLQEKPAGFCEPHLRPVHARPLLSRRHHYFLLEGITSFPTSPFS